MEDIQDSRVNKRSGASQNFSEQLYSKKLTPLNLSIAQSSEAGRRQKNQLVVQDADEDVSKNLMNPSQETLIVAMKEAYEEMFNERLISLES